MKKILYIIFLGILICGVLTACGKKPRYANLQECYESGYFDDMLSNLPIDGSFEYKSKTYYIDPNTVQFVFTFGENVSQSLPTALAAAMDENIENIRPRAQGIIKDILKDIDIDMLSILVTFTTCDMETICEYTFTYPSNAIVVYD